MSHEDNRGRKVENFGKFKVEPRVHSTEIRLVSPHTDGPFSTLPVWPVR